MDCCSWEHPEVRQPESIYLSILEVNHLDFRPGCLESFSPDGLVCEVEGELEDVCLGEDLFVGVQSVTAQLDGSLCRGPPWPNPQGSSRAAALCKSRGSFLSKSMSHHTCWVSLHLEHVEVEEDLVARSGVDEPMTLEGPVTLKKLTGQKSSELR